MFRENVLTQDEIIDRIASTMVPVALDYQKFENPRSKESQLLHLLMRPWNQAAASERFPAVKGGQIMTAVN